MKAWKSRLIFGALLLLEVISSARVPTSRSSGEEAATTSRQKRKYIFKKLRRTNKEKTNLSRSLFCLFVLLICKDYFTVLRDMHVQ